MMVACSGVAARTARLCRNAFEYGDPPLAEGAQPDENGWRYEDGQWVCPECIRLDAEHLVESIAWAD